MSTEICMPQLGMMMVEGTVVRWLAEDGASVKKGEDLLEIESDKVIQTITAPADGIVKCVASEGQVVPVLQVLGTILSTGEVTVEPEAHSPQPASTSQSPGPAAPLSRPRPAGGIRSTPIARRMAAQHGIELATITGSGPGGRRSGR